MEKENLKKTLKNEVNPLLIGLRNEIKEGNSLLSQIKGAMDQKSTALGTAFTEGGFAVIDTGQMKEYVTSLMPVFGVDYFTQKDIEDFKSYVTPVFGKDYFTDNQIDSIISRVTPKKGIDYNDGKPGHTPVKGVDYFTEAEIADFISRVTPIKGVHYRDGVPGETIYKQIGTEISAEEIRNKLESLTGAQRLKVTAIKGIEEFIIKQMAKNRMENGSSIGGGGAGSGVSSGGSGTDYELPLTFSTGLTRSTNTITSNLSTGVSGGQSVVGGTASGNNLTLSSTSNATKGNILFGTSAYDEVNNKIGIGTTNIGSKLHVASSNSADTPQGDIIMSRFWGSTTNTRASSIFHYEASAGGASDYMMFGVSGDTLGVAQNRNTPNQLSLVKMVIGANGNVGIGTTAPSSLLTVAGNITPGTSDQGTLGTTSLMWSDLFLASGGVINWNNGNMTLTHAAGSLTFAGGNVLGLGAATGTSLALTGKIGTYNNVATTGQGVPSIYGTGRSTAQTAAVASVAVYTVGAADGSFIVSANVNVTTSTAHTIAVQVDYTDETNTSRTLTLSFSQLAGTIINSITNVTGAGPYEGLPVHIRCKASTTITVKTTGTFTTVTYNVEGSITQIA